MIISDPVVFLLNKLHAVMYNIFLRSVILYVITLCHNIIHIFYLVIT